MAKIYLASSSPRRSEILKNAGFDFKVIIPKVTESLIPNMPVEDQVAHWSRQKAQDVAESLSATDIIIAADTVVWYDGNVLGKPVDKSDAFKMLTMLSGNWHSVYTGVTVVRGNEIYTEEEVTSVLMRNLTSEQIEDYIATGEPLDKAGAYGVQGIGSIICERVDGDFYNVMGLPIYRLSLILEKMGVRLFEND